jgi:RNA polymerase-binding protein DksA
LARRLKYQAGKEPEATRMAKKPRQRQAADARRISTSGAGQLDAPSKPASAAAPRRRRGARPAGPEDPRARIERERAEAVARLQALHVSPDLEEEAAPGGNESTLEEGDAAQASERRDMSFTTRERLARRINALTAALERIQRGEYGRCRVCGREIEPERLAAIPEASTCLDCQAQLERPGAPDRAA